DRCRFDDGGCHAAVLAQPDATQHGWQHCRRAGRAGRLCRQWRALPGEPFLHHCADPHVAHCDYGWPRLMSLFSIFNVAGSGMAAQSTRLNTVASNLANADSVASTPEAAYRSREPLFAAIRNGLDGKPAEAGSEGVKVLGVTESQNAITSRYEPGNPMADADGYVYQSNVNP